MALNDVPLASQTLGVTQPQIRNNFLNINNNFAVDHVTLNSGANSGKHNRVTMPEKANDNPATIANELAIYAKQGTANPYGTIAGLFLQQESGARIIEWTGFNNSAFANGTRGYATLPSGIIIKFGRITDPGPFPNTGYFLDLNDWGPAYDTVAVPYCALLTPIISTNQITSSLTIAAGPVPRLTVSWTSQSNTQFFFAVIGRQA